MTRPINYIDPTGHNGNSVDDQKVEAMEAWGASYIAYLRSTGQMRAENPYMPSHETQKARDIYYIAVDEVGIAQGMTESELMERYDHGDPWCAAFIRRCGYWAGYCDIEGYSNYSALRLERSSFKYRQNQSSFLVAGTDYIPQVGDLFARKETGHVGMVAGFVIEDGKLYLLTIEGNAGKNSNTVVVGKYLWTRDNFGDYSRANFDFIPMNANLGILVSEDVLALYDEYKENWYE